MNFDNSEIKLGNSQVVMRLGNTLVYDSVPTPIIEPNLLLRLDLNGDLLDTSGNNIPFNKDVPSGTISFVTGRKAGSLCASFNGTTSLRSMDALGNSVNLNTTTKAVSISFHMKSTQTALSVVLILAELGFIAENCVAFMQNYDVYKFLLMDNENTKSTIYVNAGIVPPPQTATAWTHVVVVVDRTLNAATQGKIYINKVQKFILLDQNGYNEDNNANYVPKPLVIGGEDAVTLYGQGVRYKGYLQNIEVYDKALSVAEVTALYNKPA